MDDAFYVHDDNLVEKWEPVLKGIDDEYTSRVTAQLLENQAKSIVSERMDEAISTGATTTGKLGTFQKFAFPIVRRVYPQLLANNLVGVQPMQGPVSQVFYIGNSRAKGSTEEVVYSRFNLTYKGGVTSAIGSVSNAAHGLAAPGGGVGTELFAQGQAASLQTGLDGDAAQNGFDLSNVLSSTAGGPTSTYGGQIAAWPETSSILGYSLSAGERLDGTGIPEMNFHVEQQAVVARTRKMRALWTLEAGQDLKAYHNLDLERELTGLLGKELQLEIDRELIEDLRMLGYGKADHGMTGFGGYDFDALSTLQNSNNFGGTGSDGAEGVGTQQVFVPVAFQYDFSSELTAATGNEGKVSNVFVLDFSQTSTSFSPRHVGDVYANLLAIINLASQDIYRTTQRGPGNWLLTSPLVASLLESSSRLTGGIEKADAPTNMEKNSIQYKGKFMGRYDLYVDPLFPTDEILMGYKGSTAMDSGYVYCPYIPLQQLPTITDPDTFQPRKGILTRYGKVAISPAERFYRVIRVVGPSANYLFSPFARNTSVGADSGLAY